MLAEGTENHSKQKKLPQYWGMLSRNDQEEYIKLRNTLNTTCAQRNRGHRVETFDAVLEAIRRFIERGNEDDWKRALVCGFCWMDRVVAINTRQLRFLVSKCKSSINGSLQKLGYITTLSPSDSRKMLVEKIPFLDGNYNELRQWTTRCRMPLTQIVLTPIALSGTVGDQPVMLTQPVALTPLPNADGRVDTPSQTFIVQSPVQYTICQRFPSQPLALSSPVRAIISQQTPQEEPGAPKSPAIEATPPKLRAKLQC